jgi:hypothetical protein
MPVVDAVKLNENLIWKGTVQSKGTVLIVGADITTEEAEILLSIGKETEEYRPTMDQDETEEAEDVRKDTTAKEMKEILKGRGVRIPFGASKDILSQLLKE